MTKAYVAALLNFFFAGLGYLVLGERRLLGVGWTLAAVGLTYVELSVQTAAPALYWPMFARVLVVVAPSTASRAASGWPRRGARRSRPSPDPRLRARGPATSARGWSAPRAARRG